MSARVRYDDAMPAEVRRAVAPLARALLPVLPAWVQDVYLYFDADEDGGNARSEHAKEYRNLQIAVTPNWLASPQGRREYDVAHEFAHAFTTELVAVAESLMAACEKHGASEAEVEFMKEQVRRADEAAVCDIARALGYPFGGK